jgi:hypothetical protein
MKHWGFGEWCLAIAATLAIGFTCAFIGALPSIFEFERKCKENGGVVIDARCVSRSALIGVK